MPTVGDQLRAARERLKLTVHDVANATNIKTDHIRAIEEGRWQVFSAPVYAKGFVRTYAQHLKVNGPQVLAELESELGQVKGFEELPGGGGRRKGPLDFLMLQFSRVRWALVFPVFLGVAIVLATVYGLRAWRAKTHHDPLQGLGSGLYVPPAGSGAGAGSGGSAPASPGRRPAAGSLALPLPTNAPAPAPTPGVRPRS